MSGAMFRVSKLFLTSLFSLSSQLLFNGRFLAAAESQRSFTHRNVVFFSRSSYRASVSLIDIKGGALFLNLTLRKYSSHLSDIFRDIGNEEEESIQNIKSDRAGFPLAAINRYNLIMSVNNVIYLRDYVY